MCRHFLCGRLFVLVASLSVVGSSGCACCALLAVGGAAGYAYSTGKHERLYSYPVGQTWEAVRQSVVELELPILSERSDAHSARLESKWTTGEKAIVTLEAKGENVTKVAIRVGTFGDDAASEQVFKQIDTHLEGGVSPPTPEPKVHVGASISR